MGQHFLDAMFHPRAIAVFGASESPHRAGTRVFRNLIRNGYAGTAYPVNPKHTKVQDRKSYARLADIEAPVDLAVVATPAPTVNAILRQCGEHGVRVAVIVSAGFRDGGEAGARLEQQLVETAAQYGLRLIGPNCPGFMRPATGLDASSLDTPARAGRLALISQSGALCTAILDWATPHGIGFSAVVPLGNMVDVGFGDFLDYLALDSKTDAILLYVEGVRHARRFMSGVRAASRMKPVIVLKAGRREGGSRAAATHSGALIGSDEVFGAALERAGVVRAYNIGQLFAAAEILQRGSRVRGERLAMVTNGSGPGALATDRAEELGITLAQLGDATLEGLEEVLPEPRSPGNPVTIPGDAPPAHYGAVVSACLGDGAVDGVLALLAPQARSQPTAAASAVIDAAHTRRGKPVLACWMGETAVAEARRLFSVEGLPDFATPELAVEAFGYLTRFNRNQKLLLETPGPLSDHRAPDVEAARVVVEGALGEGRSLLSSGEAWTITSAFHIPTLPLREARSAREALVAAEILGFPV
ncbi:MAG: CoA-binding protein, partial [Chromatiales bacterium]